MRNVNYLILCVLVVTLVLGFSANQVNAGDMMPGSADVNILLDNDQVKVSKALRSPGTIVPMHTHPRFFAYYIDAAQVKLTSPDGKETIKNIPAGKFLWFPDGTTHSVEIMGTANQNVLVVEWK